MSFSKIFQILFIVGSTFLIFIPEYLKNSWWCFSSSFSTLDDWRRVFPLNLAPFSSRFMILACCHPLIIVFDCENSFHPSRAIQDSFQFDSPEPIISEVFIPAFSSHFSKSYQCIIQVFSNHLVISSFTCIKIPSSIIIHSLILPGVSLSFLRSFSILMVVRSRFFSSCYHQFIYISQVLPVDRWRPSSSLRYIYLNPFYENK